MFEGDAVVAAAPVDDDAQTAQFDDAGARLLRRLEQRLQDARGATGQLHVTLDTRHGVGIV